MQSERAAWRILFALGILFLLYSVLTATTPLLAEEEYAGISFANLRATNPRIASVIWHDHVAFGSVNFGAALPVVILAWKGLAKGSRVAWYALLILGLASLAFLLGAHVPFGYDLSHFGPGLILNAIYLAALALSTQPVFRKR